MGRAEEDFNAEGAEEQRRVREEEEPTSTVRNGRATKEGKPKSTD
jgi:hypothetical protein